MINPSDYLTVLLTKRDELELKAEGKPFSLAVLQCCESFLALNKPPLWRDHPTFSLKEKLT